MIDIFFGIDKIELVSLFLVNIKSIIRNIIRGISGSTLMKNADALEGA